MRCQCIICQELFVNSDDNIISALDCGHTFHNACLNQWLENGRTCPSCRAQVNRKRIIQRLYFDEPEELDENIDSSKLQNEIDTLKLEVRKKEKEKNDALSGKAGLEKKICGLEKCQMALEQRVREEQSASSSHLRTLKLYESQQKSLELEKGECRRIKQKLVTLQSLDTLLNGCESEASAIISSTGEGSGATANLSRQVAFLKREYEKQKVERRQLKEQFDRVKLQLEKLQLAESHKNKKVAELTQETHKLQGLLERSEGDLMIAEREIAMLKKKNSKLKHVIQSPSAGAGSSSFTQIMNESTDMANFHAKLASTPKLSKGDNLGEAVDLDITPDLFVSPPTSQRLPASQSEEPVRKSVKRTCENDDPAGTEPNATKYLKITSAAEKAQKMKRFKSESSVTGTNNITAIASMNIFRKRGLGESNSGKSILKKGYDGLGGHTTHVNSMGNPFKKPGSKKATTQRPSKTPSLPKLDGFLTIDSTQRSSKTPSLPNLDGYITID